MTRLQGSIVLVLLAVIAFYLWVVITVLADIRDAPITLHCEPSACEVDR